MKLLKKICVALAAVCCFLLTACTVLPCKQCVDDNGDHRCDVCHTKITACADLDGNHICDTCGVSVSAHVDKNNDHACDVCATIVSEHTNKDGDHACDICRQSVSVHADEDGNHYCDTCSQKLSECVDENKDHYCEVCLRQTSVCLDGDKDGACDFCQEELTVDYETLTNQITTEYMRGIVTIYVQKRASVWDGWETVSLSSGVVYDYDESFNYLLTNNHSLTTYYQYQAAGYQTRIAVYDIHERGYEAAVVCRDMSYDLAALKITKATTDNFHYFDFAEENPTEGQKVVALGHPEGQKNAISYGEVLGYDGCNLEHEYSTVEFDCINHSAWMLQGSSGGLLMSVDGKIVGVNFAISQINQGEFASGWSIPVQKIKEFLGTNASAFVA